MHWFLRSTLYKIDETYFMVSFAFHKYIYDVKYDITDLNLG